MKLASLSWPPPICSTLPVDALLWPMQRQGAANASSKVKRPSSGIGGNWASGPEDPRPNSRPYWPGQAIAAYLKSLPPVKNTVPGPFGPKDVPSTLVSVIVPGDVFAKMPAPK
jgi:hypothetical protein